MPKLVKSMNLNRKKYHKINICGIIFSPEKRCFYSFSFRLAGLILSAQPSKAANAPNAPKLVSFRQDKNLARAVAAAIFLFSFTWFD